MIVEAGDLIALAASLGWAGTTVLARHISRAIPVVWYNALRLAIASAVMILALPWTLGETDLTKVSLLAFALMLVSVLTGFAIGDTAFFESMRRIGVSRAAPVAGCHPLVTAVMAVAFLSEPVTLSLLVGIVVIGIGVWLITTDRAPASSQRGAPPSGMAVGVALALVAAVGWSASTVLVKPALLEVDAIVTSTLRLPFATLILLLIASRSRMIDSRRLVITARTAAWLLFAGLLSVVSATLFLWSVEVVGAARTAALTSVSPIFSASIAVAFLGERITPRLALGMGVSLTGVSLIALAR